LLSAIALCFLLTVEKVRYMKKSMNRLSFGRKREEIYASNI